jgi:spermidine synthase
LTFLLTPVQTALVSAVLFVVNVWVSLKPLGIGRPAATGVSLAVAAMIAAEVGGGVISNREDPGRGYTITSSVWSRYRKIDAQEKPNSLEIYTDRLLFQSYTKNERLHLDDPRNLTALLALGAKQPVKDVLIIGGGSGADVRLLRNILGYGIKIVAVEIDDGFIRMARRFPWLWEVYNTAEIVLQEGRYFLENEQRQFDMVVYSFVDPQSAIGSVGIPDANFLYTDAGFKAAYARVRDGGVLVIQRVYLVQEQEEFVRRMCATLESAGVRPENVNIYRRPWSVAWGYYGELSPLHVVVGKGGKPPPVQDPKLVALNWIPKGRPTTDLFPFSLGTGVWFDTLLGYTKRNGLLLAVLGTAGLGLAGAMGTSLSRSAFFVLGFGSFLLESMVLFNSFLLVGDPNLSAALAVGLFLLWGGIGSWISQRWENRRWLYAAVPATVMFYVATAPLLNAATIAAPMSVRCLVFALHLAPVGVAAGMMFPIALRRFQDRSVPGLFFMDVVGCAVAPPVFWIAMSLTGVWLVMAGAFLCYAAVCALLAFRAT